MIVALHIVRRSRIRSEAHAIVGHHSASLHNRAPSRPLRDSLGDGLGIHQYQIAVAPLGQPISFQPQCPRAARRDHIERQRQLIVPPQKQDGSRGDTNTLNAVLRSVC